MSVESLGPLYSFLWRRYNDKTPGPSLQCYRTYILSDDFPFFPQWMVNGVSGQLGELARLPVILVQRWDTVSVSTTPRVLMELIVKDLIKKHRFVVPTHVQVSNMWLFICEFMYHVMTYDTQKKKMLFIWYFVERIAQWQKKHSINWLVAFMSCETRLPITRMRNRDQYRMPITGVSGSALEESKMHTFSRS